MSTATLSPSEVIVAGVPGAVTRLQFKHCKMFLSSRLAVTVWPDGRSIVNDIEAVRHNYQYHGVAQVCGYPGGERDYTRYARHHEVTHNWLAEQHGGPSLTLRAAAVEQPYPGSQREEHHVNCLQRLWADQLDRVEWREQELRAAEDALGRNWTAAFERLAYLLSSLD